MNKGGIGVGSASIVLVFAVLCLTVFSLITFVVASNDRTLVESEADLVSGFFTADAKAESIIAQILDSTIIPDSIFGIDIERHWDYISGQEYIVFSSPITDVLSIFVRMSLRDDTYEIHSFRLYNIGHWEYDGSLNVWAGPEDGIGLGLD